MIRIGLQSAQTLNQVKDRFAVNVLGFLVLDAVSGRVGQRAEFEPNSLFDQR